MKISYIKEFTGFSQTTLESYNSSLVGDAFIAGMACGMFAKRDEINKWVKTWSGANSGRRWKGVFKLWQIT